jgi:5-methylcytosine-specific restriction endonuclease McrA
VFRHVVPRALGGKTTWDDIVTACVPCNQLQRAQVAEELVPRVRAGGREASASHVHAV